jgi:hypothetical protein
VDSRAGPGISRRRQATTWTLIGVAGFSIPESVELAGGIELCALSKEHSLYPSDFPCVPMKAPEPAQR